MGRSQLSTTRTVAVFALYGPMPAAGSFLIIAIFSLGLTAVVPWLVFLFFSYACGLVPAAVTGMLWAITTTDSRSITGENSIIFNSLKGAALGFVVGGVSGWVVFGTSPDLIQPVPLLNRVLNNFLVWAVPGFFGGALAGARVAYLTRSRRPPSVVAEPQS